MYTSILITLDGSAVAESVLPYTRALTELFKIPVQLLSVVEIGAHLGSEKARYLDMLREDCIKSSRDYLKRIARTFRGADVKCAVEEGRVDQVIVAQAGADAGTLIAMATHGRSGIGRWLLGSVTEKVLRSARNSVLVVRGTEEGESESRANLDSVIVPLDGSELAASALSDAVELAKAFNWKVILLRAFDRKQIVAGYTHEHYIPERNELELAWKGAATSYLDSKVRLLKGEGLVNVIPVVSVGEAAETIIELAKGAPNSLIAMCTHGRAGVKRWVMGSITEKVVRYSGNPVLVIRAKRMHN